MSMAPLSDIVTSLLEAGVDVFCRESLASDWLETIERWQPAEGQRAYTPHPDFWVAALWRNLMGVQVLGSTANIIAPRKYNSSC